MAVWGFEMEAVVFLCWAIQVLTNAIVGGVCTDHRYKGVWGNAIYIVLGSVCTISRKKVFCELE